MMVTAKNNYDYTGASRQAAYVERLKAKGMKQTQVWAHPDDVLKIRAFAAELVSERSNPIEKTKAD
jgi:phospholipase/lecithinase/hemolysin